MIRIPRVKSYWKVMHPLQWVVEIRLLIHAKLVQWTKYPFTCHGEQAADLLAIIPMVAQLVGLCVVDYITSYPHWIV